MISRRQLFLRRLVAADHRIGIRNGLLQCLPVLACAVNLFVQFFRIFYEAVQRDQHLEGVVLFLDVLDQFMEFVFPVVLCHDSLVVDAQAVCLHLIQEPVQQRLGQVAKQHELGIKGCSCPFRFGSFVAIQSGQITNRLV